MNINYALDYNTIALLFPLLLSDCQCSVLQMCLAALDPVIKHSSTPCCTEIISILAG